MEGDGEKKILYKKKFINAIVLLVGGAEIAKEAEIVVRAGEAEF